MLLLSASLIAGVLTVAAPCILPLLPVIVGGSVIRVDGSKENRWYRPLIIAASLAASITIFTLLLKATTILLGVPQMVWQITSGLIIILFGLNLLAPRFWTKLMASTGLESKSNRLLGASRRFSGLWADILLGAALGPVFASCSPTYALIVAAVLPVSFIAGLAYLGAYSLGLAAALLAIVFAGQKVTKKLGWLSNPKGGLYKITGILFLVVGTAIIFGTDKDIQTFLLEKGIYYPIEEFEKTFTDR